MYPPPPIAKYVTPHGTGDHSGSSWSNAYSFNNMQDNLASNTTYNLIDSTFIVDSIFISNLSGLSFIGKGKTKTILQWQSNPFDDDPYLWSIKGFDLENADNITIKDLQIRKFRGFGIRVDAASSYFFCYNNYIDSCGWDAFEGGEQVIKSPCAVKLFGDNGHIGQTQIMNSGWDGMQIAGYRTTVDSSIIYSTGEDEPDANHQGDGVHMFQNPDSSYWVPYGEDSIEVYKTGQARFVACDINTVVDRKSGIEGGWDSIYYDQDSIPYLLEKPLVQVTNSTVIGGKGIGITQDDHPRVGHFSTKIENCKIGSLNPIHPTARIDWADALTSPTTAWIKNNTFYSPEGYGPDCPVLEYYTDSTAVLYLNNKWRLNNVDNTFCVEQNLP
ncbi:MAG: hypothetical protein IPJ03_02635 [Ignavibacteriales bacterium]|nr:hypothetical protein [Ignavibacteriales bacterium]